MEGCGCVHAPNAKLDQLISVLVQGAPNARGIEVLSKALDPKQNLKQL